MIRFHRVAAACICLLATAMTVDAQLVRISSGGGVRVRAPFVSVNVLPYGGGTRVRAPFTSVNTGLYGIGYGPGYYSHRPYPYGVVPVYPQPVYPEPVYPVSGYVASQPSYPAVATPIPSTTELLDKDLRAAAQRLEHSLSRRPDDADVWIDYLKPGQIIESIDRGESPDSLKLLLANYEGLSGNSQLSQIWTVDGFRQTHHLLRQWVQRADDNSELGPSALDTRALDKRALETKEPQTRHLGPSALEPSKVEASKIEASKIEPGTVGPRVVAPIPEPDTRENGPTPAKPIRAADDIEREELPLPATPTSL